MFARPELAMSSLGHEYGGLTANFSEVNSKWDVHVERTITTSDGVRLAVRDHGDAGVAEHTVVLLHGLLLTQDVWDGQIRALTRLWGDGVRIITYDHRGHGRSAAASMHTYRIDRLAADLAEVLTALHVAGPLTLGGHSMGGMTALAYLGRPRAERPVDPQGLVLIATAAGRLDERGIGRLLGVPGTRVLFDLVNHMPRAATDRVVNAMARRVRDLIVRYSASAEGRTIATECTRSISLASALGFLEDMKRYDQYHMLSSIVAKTVVVSGGTDAATPAAHSYDIAAAIPGAIHMHRPTDGHMLLVDAPHCVTTAITEAMGLCRAADAPNPLAADDSAPELAAAAS